MVKFEFIALVILLELFLSDGVGGVHPGYKYSIDNHYDFVWGVNICTILWKLVALAYCAQCVFLRAF